MVKMQCIGHLGKDAIVNNVNGKTVINFSVAHTEKFKDAQGAQKEKTLWVDCAYWTDRTGVAPYLVKGAQVYVDGAPDLRTYTTQDGKFGASIIVRVASIQLVGGNKTSDADKFKNVNEATQRSYNTSAAVTAPDDTDGVLDDLPF